MSFICLEQLKPNTCADNLLILYLTSIQNATNMPGIWHCIDEFIFHVKFLCFFFQWVGNIDLTANDQADANIIVDKDAGWTEQESAILDQLQGLLSTNQLDAVICVAGKYIQENCVFFFQNIYFDMSFFSVFIQADGPEEMQTKIWQKMPN